MLPTPSHTIWDQPVVEIGQHADLDADQHKALLTQLEDFRPWKKGPFKIFGHHIDSEWRSDLKWERLKPHIPNLADQTVCDIGCNNGYFMYRMLAEKPREVIGMEPVLKHKRCFDMLQSFLPTPQLRFDTAGVEDIAKKYPGYFDTVFCLGILYHHTDPVSILRKIFTSMKSGSHLIVDCMGIPGESSVALTPAGRYARCKGIWFLPTQSCLENWMRRANFRHIETFFAAPLTPDEQRKTAWADIDSLKEALDPNDPNLTVEGYPAPYRFYVRARR